MSSTSCRSMIVGNSSKSNNNYKCNSSIERKMM